MIDGTYYLRSISILSYQNETFLQTYCDYKSLISKKNKIISIIIIFPKIN